MAQDPLDEPRSLRDRVKGLVRRATKPVASVTDAVTGRSLEQQIADYSDTFTQVALGLHDDVAAASRRIAQLEATVAESSDQPGEVEEEKERDTTAYLLAAAALVVALIALGVAVWATL